MSVAHCSPIANTSRGSGSEFMRTGQIAVALFTVLSTIGATGQSRSYFWWIAHVEQSQRVGEATSPTFVLYGPQAVIDLKWTFKNDEGTEIISVVPGTLQSHVKMTVTKDTAPIGAAIAWASVGSWVVSGQAASVGSEQVVQLQPGDWLEWRASVRRNDSSSWTRGTYECAIDMASALRTLSSEGRSWRGRAVTEGKLTIQIADGTTLAARKAERAGQAARSLADGQPLAAVAHYQAMVQADPTDRAGYAGLGLALVAARQFKEAVAALEVALPSALEEKSTIPETLAYAYVALGDEVNAARVLRLVVPESQVTARLDRLRAAARNASR